MSTDSSTNPSSVPRDAVGGGHSDERDNSGVHRGGGHGPASHTGGHGHNTGEATAGGKKRRNRRGRRRRRPTQNTAQQRPAGAASGPTAATAENAAANGSAHDHQRIGATDRRNTDRLNTDEKQAHHARARVSKPKPSDLAVTTNRAQTDPTTNGHATPQKPRPRPPTSGDTANQDSEAASTQRSVPKPGPKPTPGPTPPSGPKPKPTGGRNRRRRDSKPAENLRTVRETSAGGLVIADLDLPIDDLSAALIGRVDRRGRMMWSLPKGHIETGETAETTAIREVAEETGIEGTVVAPLGKIDYWFVSEGKRIHKTVHHYLLRSTGGELSAEDYEVSEVAWVLLRDLPRTLTYPDERRLARMARGVITDLVADPRRMAQSEADSCRTEPNAYERAAAARNERRNETSPPARPRRRRRQRRKSHGDD